MRISSVLVVVFAIVASILPLTVIAADGDGSSTDQPYGYCTGSFCEVVDPEVLPREDARLLDPDAHFSDEGDPPGLIVCSPGEGCDYDEDADPDDPSGPDGDQARSDADPRGLWNVKNLRGTVRCKGLGARRIDPSRTQGRIATNGSNSFTGHNLGERATTVTFTRLGPGTYKSLPTNIRVQGQRIRIDAYLVMTGADRFKGVMWGNIRGKAKCDFERRFEGRRARAGSAPDEPVDGPPEPGPDGPPSDSTTEQQDDGPPDATPAPTPTPTPTPTPRPSPGGGTIMGDPVLRFGNASTETVDVYVNGALWAGMAPRAITRAAIVPAGPTVIEVYAAGADLATSEPLVSQTIELFEGSATGISIVGDASGLELRPLDET